ncbi:DUF4870 domain-containing protein [Robertmurraya andreesenii]|uniref:Tic20 family protein n=1 Tax=Anoxybacillus andreesenii TaxID=1325932 RepID=A0ABT9V7V6_9BACL|nr:DUF4870 domain-containing protein [Robertmurraya andreesenii]MDQ0157043.1 putative Tic20 family protein [Robertmurraya andreesenii]
MDTNKVLSALSYFSIFFAGIIFPLIVWLVASDKVVKGHAKKAFFSHIITLIPVPIIIFSVIFDIVGGYSDVPVMFFISIIVTVILSLIVLIWNIVKGIQVLTKESIY